MPGISGIDGPAYLEWLISLGYDLSLIEPDGALLPAHKNVELVMAAYLRRGIDHVDIVASYG
jgi:hypothetical protein